MSQEIELSVIVPIKNESGNIEPLVREIAAALEGVTPYEIIYVDDGSTDDGPAVLARLQQTMSQLRVVRHAGSCGQSAAIRTGVMHARGRLIGTLDGDGQNDPADLPKLLAKMNALPGVEMVAGQRVRRQDTLSKKISSKIANRVRSAVLQDDTPDTGCGTKMFSREAFLRLPYFDHMHRFLPALMKREGFAVGREAVNHRPRMTGRSKYGINNRLWVGIVDLIGVWWLTRRMRRPTVLPAGG